MNSTLPAAHLMRQFLLFALVVVFMLTMIRAAYALWHFPELEPTGAFVALFVQGLRFDLALVGAICLVPALLGTLFAMFSGTRIIAKWLTAFFLFGGLAIILLLEFITPWFLENMQARPDLDMIKSVEAPIEVIKEIAVFRIIPLVIGILLCSLIMVAYWGRMELSRFLRFPINKPGAVLLFLFCGFLCALAVRSKLDFTVAAMGIEGSKISTNDTINDIALNTTYKMVYSLIAPFIN